MEVSRIRALRGPNLWTRNTAIEAIVVCSGNERSLDTLPGFEQRLRERFPEIGYLKASGHYEAVPLARVLEFAVLDLQANAGCPVTFSRTSESIQSGTYQVVVEYSEEDVGRLAFDLAEKLIKA